jgi:hypothetical protein
VRSVLVLFLVLDLDGDGDEEDENEVEVDRDVEDEAAFGKWAEPAVRPLADPSTRSLRSLAQGRLLAALPAERRPLTNVLGVLGDLGG